MKADLDIYSHVVDASGQCMCAFIGLNLDLITVLVMVFVNSVTNYKHNWRIKYGHI